MTGFAMKFEGKVALVTGSSRGIGKSIALELAREGAKLVLDYHVLDYEPDAESNVNKVLSEIKKIGSEGITLECDVSDEEQVKKMVEEAIKKFGKIDILVNNAGIVYDVPLFEKTVEQWNKTIGTNLISVFLCSKYVSPYMKKNNSGAIINISSSNGLNVTSPQSADYDASKTGVINFTKSLAEELAPYNVRVNAIAPGWIDTDMNKDLPEDFIEEEKNKTFMKRFGKPEEIAKVAAFLASDDASFMTGSNVLVDGGYK
jgi:3-oxoacyl-[acyl-carrier protein] reductase